MNRVILMSDVKKILRGHVSPETAYVVDDYPYSWKLRCKIRYWIETKPGFGQRMVSQTTNPKKGDVWNKPKMSTYCPVMIMYLDQGQVHWDGLSFYSSEDVLNGFIDEYGEPSSAEDPALTSFIQFLRAAHAMSRARDEAIKLQEAGIKP